MKTTIDISDVLFHEIKRIAQRDATSMRALIERGIAAVIDEDKRKKPSGYKLKDCSFGSGGVTEEFIARGGFANLREIANER